MRPQLGAMKAQGAHETGAPTATLDEFFESWASWREACAHVRHTYQRWSRARASERDPAFESYRAALDLEEQAASVHAACAQTVSSRM